MSQEQWIILALRVVLIFAEAGALAFIAVYTAIAPWWKNPIGKTVVRLDILLAAALLPSILSLFFHFSRLTSHLAAWIDVAIFALIGLELFRRIPMWIRFHRNKTPDGEKEPS